MSYAFTRDVPADEHHYAEVRTAIGAAAPEGLVVHPAGWVLPDLYDPDGHEMRFYVTGEGAPTADRPARIHDAGPGAWIEQLDRLDLAPTR